MTLLYNHRRATLSGNKYAPAVRLVGGRSVERIRIGLRPGEHLFSYELQDGMSRERPAIGYLSGTMTRTRGQMYRTYDNRSTGMFPCGGGGQFGVPLGGANPFGGPDPYVTNARRSHVREFAPFRAITDWTQQGLRYLQEQ